MQSLFLNRCELQDEDAIEIIRAIFLSSNIKIKKIYFNNNRLTKLTAYQIADVLREGNTKIKELGLKWNQIDGEGGVAIAEALSENRDLKVLDLSWNKIGTNFRQKFDPKSKKTTVVGKDDKEVNIGKIWGKALRENKVLVHLDLSFNKICQEDTESIMEDIVNNNTLVGFHYLGNINSGPRTYHSLPTGQKCSDEKVGRIDSMGFIRMEDNSKQLASDQHMLMSLPSGYPHSGAKSTTFPRLKNVLGTQSRMKDSSVSRLSQPNRHFVSVDTKIENCWICENWVETHF